MEHQEDLPFLNYLCLPPLDVKPLTERCIRPERLAGEEYKKYGPADDMDSNGGKWARVLEEIQNAIDKGKGECTPNCFRGNGDPRRPHLHGYSDRVLTAAFECLSAIMYEMESSSSCQVNAVEMFYAAHEGQHYQGRYFPLREEHFQKPPEIIQAIDMLIPYMLRVDYGVHPVNSLCGARSSSWELQMGVACVWHRLLEEFCRYLLRLVSEIRVGFCPDILHWQTVGAYFAPFRARGWAISDVAIMLYHYHTHRAPAHPYPVRPKEESGKQKAMPSSGYMGVMQEMIDELPTCGYSRLQRKLSVDVNEVIRWCIGSSEERKAMIRQLEMLASQCGIPLDLPGSDSFGETGRPRGLLRNGCVISNDGASLFKPFSERVYYKGGSYPITMRELAERRRVSAGWAKRWRGEKLKME